MSFKENCLEYSLNPKDFMLTFFIKKFGEDEGIKKYLEGGLFEAKKLSQLIDSMPWTFLSKKPSPIKILDFATGYGRILRHLPQIRPNDIIHGSDIHNDACDFIKNNFSIKTYLSDTNASKLSISENYDFISVISLFSHLPDGSFPEFIEALYDLLNPGGYLFFTSNGISTTEMYPEFYGSIYSHSLGYGFKEHSEQDDLDVKEYGSMVVSASYVIKCISKIKDAQVHSFRSSRWGGYQDEWVIKKPC